jgi:chain length determinant protein EpsF
MSLLQFLSILRARWAAAGLILGLTVVSALAYAVLRPGSYEARVPVLVDLKANEVGGGYSPALVASYMATQIDVARSEPVVARALELLQPGVSLQGPAREMAMQRLQEGLQVRPARESNIIHIQWAGADAGEAARAAGALARAFVDVNLSLRTGPARQDAGWFDQQVARAREAMAQAQVRLADHQRRSGIVGSEQADHEIARLNQLATRLAEVQADTTDSQSKRGASRETVTEVIESPLINGLKADLARLEARRQEAAATLGPRHPQMERLDAEVGALQARLSTETRRIGAAIETRYRAGRERERELAAALSAQRERVLAIHQDRAQMALLQQDVEAARRQFETVSTHASRARLESLATQTNLVVLTPSAATVTPTGPTPRQALAVGTVAGLLLAVAGAILLELAGRRVRSVDDIAQAARLPVLAVLPAASAMAALAAPPRRLGHAGGGTA